MKSLLRTLSPFIPYVAVVVGLYGFHSAWGAIVAYHLLAAATVALGGATSSGRAGTGHRTPVVWLSVLVFACCGVALYVVWPYAINSDVALARLQTYGLTRLTWPYFAVYFCVMNTTLEEYFWRGYLHDDSPRLRANDLLFGGYHAVVLLAFAGPVWTLPVFAACAFAGWLWRRLKTLTGSLAFPIATHLMADVGIVLAVHYRLFG